jgi:hypothetical protein
MFIAWLVIPLAAAAPTIGGPVASDGQVRMTAAQIRQYNADLPPDHPNYIRCERLGETGSLVRRRSVCRTNAEWKRVEEAGNRDARETEDALRKGWSSSFEPKGT